MKSEARSFFESLCKNNIKRQGCVFKTVRYNYFFDAGTGKTFACDTLEFQIMEKLFETSNMESLSEVNESNEIIEAGLQSIYELVMIEHILSMPVYTNVTNRTLQHGQCLNQIVLELTQSCNLRCRYCVFNEDFDIYHSFQNKNMTWETAKHTIDYALKHSHDELFIGFYGGEPLLNYPLLKRCIEYCENTHKDTKVCYSITSNLTLMNEEMAAFLSQVPNISILCSIDGPEGIHNTYRKQTDGKGSFDRSLEGLQLLVSRFKERTKDCIAVNSVICPPYDEPKFNAMKNFFENETMFPKGMKFRYSYVSKGSLKDVELEHGDMSVEAFYAQGMAQTDPFKYFALKNMCLNDNIEYEKTTEAFALTKMQNRFLCDQPMPFMARNGCCNPGYERLFVSVDGDFKVCEKVGETSPIGNIKDGLNESFITDVYYDEYDAYSLEHCNHCWAVHLCDLCYATCMGKEGLHKQRKQQMCSAVKSSVKNNLIEYYTLLETKPEIIEALDGTYIIGFDE